MKKFLCLVGTLTLLLTSCSSDNSAPDISIDTTTKPTKMFFLQPDNTPIYVTDMLYDGNKLVSGTDDDGYAIKYTYTGNVISKIEQYEPGNVLTLTTELLYSNGKLTTQIERQPNKTSYFETKYTYSNDGVISYEGREVNSNNIAVSMGKFTYKDGNVVKKETYYQGKIDAVYSYEYDTKNNPQRNILGFNLLINWPTTSSVNNLVKYREVLNAEFDNSYTYTYNENNFPIEQKRFGKNGVLEAITKFVY